ncbi:hypothetical protein PIB30_043400 [Stylosanthes scabra]|uniref:Uncharacterized protein n=1 Tax=Stylosanthes scabra TaxID=79078 RepID=A0ABU6RFK2_9FABA|nr:hypothetical protein [Stylosanthes scabra]
MEEQDPFHSRDEAPPPSSALFQMESAGVFISSMPDTQSHGGFDARGSTQEQDDVFHTLPEKSSVPSSCEKPPDHRTVNQELDAFNDSLEFVDFGDSQGARVCLGIESLETQQSNGTCKGVVDVARAGEQVCGANEIPIKENEGNELMCGEEARELEFPREEKVQNKNKSSIVFDVLRFLAETEVQELRSDNKQAGCGAAADDDIGNAGFFDVVKIGGIDFLHPRWWPEDDNNEVLFY